MLGGGHLPDELDAFNTEWQHGISAVGHEIHRLSAHLQQAVHHYQQVDGQVAAVAKHHHAGGAPAKVRSAPAKTAHGHDRGRGASGSGRTSIGQPIRSTATTTIGGPGPATGTTSIGGSGPVTGRTSIGGGTDDGTGRDRDRGKGAGPGGSATTTIS